MERDELAEYLESLKREDCYRVQEVLKESPFEVTQLVSFVGANGAQRGPYIRKFIKRDSGLGGVYERLFEVQSSGARFKHVPVILECYQRDGDFAVVMECARGETLQDHVAGHGGSVELAREVFPQLCDAVTELHADFDPPIIHRDLKPSNVVLSPAGLTIVDFGIAREYREGAAADTVHFGTRSFAPPEQFGFGQTTVRSDVYALGMLLLFCLTGEVCDPVGRERLLSGRSVPEPLQEVVMRATAFDPARRYGSAAELEAAFLQAVSNVAGASAPPPPSDEGGDATRGRRLSPLARLGESAASRRGHALGKVFNGVLIGFAAIVCIVSFSDIWITPDDRAGYPFWFNAFNYGVLVPLVTVGFCFACLDKRRMRRKVPAMGKVRGWRAWALFVVLVVVLAFANAAVASVTGAPLTGQSAG